MRTRQAGFGSHEALDVHRNEVSELHYITPIENLPSILERGVLSHRAVEQLSHRSVAMTEIQDRRAKVSVPGGNRLHDYVNLYINGRNPMMFTVVRSQGADSLCMLRVTTDVIDTAGVVVTDCNASSDYARFTHPTHGFSLIDRDEVFARYWTHTDYYAQLRHKSRMCAEVLVPGSVEARYITGIYVGNQVAAKAIGSLGLAVEVMQDGNKFFQ